MFCENPETQQVLAHGPGAAMLTSLKQVAMKAADRLTS
jgi:hypothetical protein